MGRNRLREVNLGSIARGRLFLCEMPGRYAPLEDYEREMRHQKITRILCLAPLDEIERKSPDYAAKLKEDRFFLPVDHFPIADYSVPDDPSKLAQVAKDAALRLQEGERLVIHCGAGVGRTGTVAIAVLMALGLSLEDARQRVKAAGSEPETDEQWTLVRSLRERLGG